MCACLSLIRVFNDDTVDPWLMGLALDLSNDDVPIVMWTPDLEQNRSAVARMKIGFASGCELCMLGHPRNPS